MQAIELSANIGPDHELRITLPDHTATGTARVIVLFESAEPTPGGGNLDAFLDRLPINAEGGPLPRSGSGAGRGRTRYLG